MYRTICTELWTDPEIKSLDVPTKLLFLYLITNPHTHLSGIYYCPAETILKETGLKLIPYRYGIDTLSRLEKAHADDRTETIFVVNMFAYQGQGPKNEASASKHLETLHNSCLIPLFLKRYPQIPYRYPIQSCPSVPVPVLLVNSSPDSDLKSKSRSISVNEEFEQFWRAYPRKVGKKKALQAWQKATDKPQVVDIIKAIDLAKKSEQWTKENGQFIPHPSTWLNEGRWSDQPLTNGHGKSKPPPFPPKTDPIARGQWRTAYGDPAQYGYK